MILEQIIDQIKSREREFRVWDKDRKKMIYGFTPDAYYNRVPSNILQCWIMMDFTGQLDANGKKIFEGDIVRFHYFFASLGAGDGLCENEHSLIGVVTWGEYGWGVSKIKGEHWRGYTGYSDGEGESSFIELCAMNESSIHEESFEVLGNIFENPELFEGG